jgi:hypothetical protein
LASGQKRFYQWSNKRFTGGQTKTSGQTSGLRQPIGDRIPQASAAGLTSGQTNGFTTKTLTSGQTSGSRRPNHFIQPFHP